MDPRDKRLAVAVPDHSISYIDYEGRISEGSYGAGEVRIWDNGSYETSADPEAQLEKGKLVFEMFGLKLRGEFALVKMGRDEKNWLVIKADDHFANREWKLETVLPAKPSRSAKKK
jgi:bifunctional non-homologous end joining protein LigD